nr:hypothetical protein [Tanacetum cinerariifolium]
MVLSESCLLSCWQKRGFHNPTFMNIFLDDEPVNPEPAPVIHHHAPTPPEGYINDDDIEDDEEDPDEDPKEEPIEQVIPEQNNMDGFALHMNPQPAGNMNGWLIEDDDEEVEEDGVDNIDDEEIEVDEEDKDDGVDDNEDEACSGPVQTSSSQSAQNYSFLLLHPRL